jgi:glyoxylase-like metal-dependent hydrolase (beta-lactamase superfamily II)
MLVAPRIRRLLAPNPSPLTGDGTNTYLVGEQDIVVVDPGPDLPEHIAAILAAASRGRRITALAVTHGHPDHLPAAFSLRERVGAPILGHPSLSGIDRPLHDGALLEMGDVPIAVLETPGHARDHLAFWIAADRVLLAGDLIAGTGTVVLDETADALERYLESLGRVLVLDPRVILPGHGPLISDGRAKIREYLAHRAERDRQILAVLQKGETTIDEIVRQVYTGVPPPLQPLAARNVRAHLARLASLGKVTRRGDRWRLSEDAGRWR